MSIKDIIREDMNQARKNNDVLSKRVYSMALDAIMKAEKNAMHDFTDEEIVAANMPAITTPAIIGGKKEVDKVINMFSALEPVRCEVGKSCLPTIPINTATSKDITTHTIAILLDGLSSFSDLIAINLSKTCGIPKYPKPQASVDITVRKP